MRYIRIEAKESNALITRYGDRGKSAFFLLHKRQRMSVIDSGSGRYVASVRNGNIVNRNLPIIAPVATEVADWAYLQGETTR